MDRKKGSNVSVMERPVVPTASVDRLMYSPIEAAWQLSVSRARLYELMSEGQIRSVKIGTRRLIPRQALIEFVESLQAAA